jgi:predicted HNH restriction endonuclease
VHHIIPIEKDWGKRLDANNLKLLCPECHRLAHERGSPLQEFNKFWDGL